VQLRDQPYILQHRNNPLQSTTSMIVCSYAVRRLAAPGSNANDHRS
jgi:hypothetical protein